MNNTEKKEDIKPPTQEELTNNQKFPNKPNVIFLIATMLGIVVITLNIIQPITVIEELSTIRSIESFLKSYFETLASEGIYWTLPSIMPTSVVISLIFVSIFGISSIISLIILHVKTLNNNINKKSDACVLTNIGLLLAHFISCIVYIAIAQPSNTSAIVFSVLRVLTILSVVVLIMIGYFKDGNNIFKIKQTSTKKMKTVKQTSINQKLEALKTLKEDGVLTAKEYKDEVLKILNSN